MNVCARCNKILKGLSEIHATHGLLFCSKECAICHFTDDIIMNASAMATEYYESSVDILHPNEILAEDEVDDVDRMAAYD